jgi:LuxR family maltose regulon positive regulatory protein
MLAMTENLGKPLTAREQQVCELVARGFQNKEIATTLRISVRTVEWHRASVFAKKGVRNAVELVRSVFGGTSQ